MRIFIALLACTLALSSALANDAPTGHAAEASKASSAKEAPKEAAKEAPKDAAKEAAKEPPAAKPLSAAALRAREEAQEAALSSNIAARLAALRARQAERAKQAAHGVKKKASHAAVSASAIAAVVGHEEHWTYEGNNGPQNWGRLNAAWAKCGIGARQSPIDIRNGIKVDLEQISFDYQPSGFSVIDNGHTVQVSVSGGNFITVTNRQYELIQFHFHRPSEERINGKSFEMVVHMVHKDPEGNLAVIAVLIERGKPHDLIQTVWNNLPLEKNDTVTPSISIDMNKMLPTRRDYFTYMGSLTTPPCTEGVLWMVMKEPVQAAPAQLALFSRLYPLNARPIQSAAGRMIKESN